MHMQTNSCDIHALAVPKCKYVDVIEHSVDIHT